MRERTVRLFWALAFFIGSVFANVLIYVEQLHAAESCYKNCGLTTMQGIFGSRDNAECESGKCYYLQCAVARDPCPQGEPSGFQDNCNSYMECAWS